MGDRERRPDLVLYVNGIAVAVLELKGSSVSIGDGIRQNLSDQQPEFHQWFLSTVQLVFAGNDTEGLQLARGHGFYGRSSSTTSERCCTRSRTTFRPSGEMTKSGVRFVNWRRMQTQTIIITIDELLQLFVEMVPLAGSPRGSYWRRCRGGVARPRNRHRHVVCRGRSDGPSQPAVGDGRSLFQRFHREAGLQGPLQRLAHHAP
jgi:hypothetical protein